MMMFRFIALALLLSSATNSLAVDNWQLSGFATLAVNKLNRPNLYLGATEDQWGADSDSKLGLQLQGNLLDRLSFTAQVVSSGLEFYGKEAYEPELSWLFLSYQIDTNTRVRLGRMRASNYLYSETQDIGYSYIWVRPPLEVYPYIYRPLSDMDGFDMSHTWDLSERFELNSQLFVGRREGNLSDKIKTQLTPSFGGNFSLQGRDFLIRYSLHLSETSVQLVDLIPLSLALEQAYLFAGDPLFKALSETLYASDKRSIYQALGVQWDFGNWSLVSETYSVENAKSGYAYDTDGWYVSLGYHWGNITPYAVLAQYDSVVNEHLKDDLSQALQDYNASPTLFSLLARVDAVYHYLGACQRSHSAGVRWDFAPDFALTAELQYFEFLNGTAGQSISITRPAPTSTTLINIAVDWVF